MTKNHKRSSKIQRGWRKFAADLSALALVVQLLAPVLMGFGAHADPPADGLSDLNVICSASGVIYLQDEDGNSSTPVAVDCPFCHLNEVKVDLLDASDCVAPMVQADTIEFVSYEPGYFTPHSERSAPTRAPPA